MNTPLRAKYLIFRSPYMLSKSDRTKLKAETERKVVIRRVK